MNVNIITVGKLKEDYLRAAQAEYTKRLGAFCSIKVVELNEFRLPDNPSPKQIESALAEEAKLILNYTAQKGSANVALCIEGKQQSSEELARSIEKWGVDGFSTLNFIIGSSYGLSEQVKSACLQRLSMSKMTFPHQLARVMLLEQIYRSFQIIKGTKYHK